MLKYALVRFEQNGFKYKYFTNITNLTKGNHVLCDSSNGLGVAKFINYSNDKSKATKWIVKKINLQSLRNNLKCELEEEGIAYQQTNPCKEIYGKSYRAGKSELLLKSIFEDNIKW